MRWITSLGAPGRYVLIAVIVTPIWFLARLWLDHGDPILSILTRSGLYGATWAFWPWLLVVMPSPRPKPEPGPVNRRGGIIVGLSVGLPFFGALLALCLSTGRWVSAGCYVVVLIGVAAAAAWSYRKERKNARMSPTSRSGASSAAK